MFCSPDLSTAPLRRCVVNNTVVLAQVHDSQELVERYVWGEYRILSSLRPLAFGHDDRPLLPLHVPPTHVSHAVITSCFALLLAAPSQR